MYSSEGSGDFTERTYNFKTRDLNHEGPISATEIIDIAPEGEGWRFVVQKRQYDRRHKTAEDCPLSDPDDSNDALENALFLESAVNGMKLGVRVKCGYKCRGREGFCTKCKNAVPLHQLLQLCSAGRVAKIAAAALTTNRTWKSLQTLVAKKILPATLI